MLAEARALFPILCKFFGFSGFGVGGWGWNVHSVLLPPPPATPLAAIYS